MKRFIKFLVMSLVIVIVAFAIFKVTKQYNLDVIHDEIDWSIDLKGCKDATGFDMDKSGNLFISFKNNIRMISTDGKDTQVLKDSNLNILDFVCDDKNLYIATDNKIIRYNMETSESVDLVTNIPNNGINSKVKLLLGDECLYFAVGSSTNSGIVNKEGEPCDIPSISFVLEDANYGERGTGIYKPYGVRNIDGEKIDEKGRIGNGTLMKYDLKHKQTSIYSHGIRNIEGLDINSKNKIYAIVGGMEDEGARAVKDDTDYIYEINESAWYGWPDFSGGDPITSPRFTDGTNKLSFVLKQHPNKTPTGPLYEHNSVSSLKGLAIDDEGFHLNENQIIFGDNKQHKIFALDGRRAIPIGTLDEDSNIQKIMVNREGVFILDSGTGCIYKFEQKGDNNLFNLSPIYWIFASGFLITILLVIIVKYKKGNIGK